ncbi:hypothetical protein R1A27_22525 [Methylobacterium sp. NMS12]
MSWNLDGPWSLTEVDCGSDYVATVAVRSAEAEITCHHLSDDWPEHLG